MSSIEATSGRRIALAVKVLRKVLPALREIAMHENLAQVAEPLHELADGDGDD